VNGLCGLTESGEGEEVHDGLFGREVIAGNAQAKLEKWRLPLIFEVRVIDEAHELGNGTGRHGGKVCKNFSMIQ
jgi:hypothetical protein